MAVLTHVNNDVVRIKNDVDAVSAAVTLTSADSGKWYELASSTGVISGTETGSTETTTYTFEITPTDAESQAGAAREFTMTISHGATGGGQFN